MNFQDTKLDSFLRKETTDIHQRTEEALEPLELFTNLSLKKYSTFVLIQYRWHEILESVLASINSSYNFDGYHYNPKTPLLLKDLKALNIAPKKKVPININELSIPGIIYVLEGSMLGGTVISKQLAIGGIQPMYRHYFSHCAKSAKNVWPLTRKYLQSIEYSQAGFELCLETSKYCFELMIDLAREEIVQNTQPNRATSNL